MSRIRSLLVAGLAPFMVLLASVGGAAAYAATAPPHIAGTELKVPPAWRFEEPLIATAPTTSAEDQALLEAIRSYRQQDAVDDFRSLDAFLSQYPHSGWKVALLTNMGLSDYRYGHFSKATDTLLEAWQAGKSVTEPHGKALADRAFGELVEMHARLGHKDQLPELLKQIENRPVSGSATEEVDGAKEGLWTMIHNPGIAYLCGPMALKNLLLFKGASNERVRFLDEYRSGPDGVTLDQVSGLADKADLPHRLVFRRSGESIPVPSIVHWKVNHFAAILGEERGRFHIQDPTFGADLWVTRAALDAESSGYFLVPNLHRVSYWRDVDASEASHVRGTGYPGGFWTYLAFLLSPQAHQTTTCPKGMCGYNVTAMAVSLNLNDMPVGYAPPKGPPVYFKLTYNQRETNQPAVFSWSNVSPKWTHNWLTYIQDDPTYPGVNVMRYAAGGGSVLYSGYNAQTGAFTAEEKDASVLVRTSASPITYQRRLSDGSVEVYSQSNGATAAPRLVFLTQLIDPFGNSVSLAYDNQLRLTSITDATGRATTFSYELSSQPLLITKVTDPFGRSAKLTYDASGRLSQITDVLGLTSAFSYDSSSLINVLTTPYGTTNFSYGDNGNQRWVNATDPLGHTERVEYLQGAPGIPFYNPANTVPRGILNPDNAYLNGRDTFIWDKHAYAVAAGDYTKAKNYHWTHYTPSTNYAYDAIESIQQPLENRVWFTYPGQPGSAGFSGTYDQPNAMGRVLDDGSTQLTQTTYNTLGHPTDILDPLGRETKLTYASNQIDIVQVQQKTSTSGFSTIAAFTYNTAHLPLTYTDAAGQTTSYAYNSAGQITSSTDALGEVTTYQYDSLGYLTTIVNANDQTAANFTYDQFGHVATKTDSEGYTVSYAYDSFDRVTTETYPDTTTRVLTWNNLDLASVKDRQGRVTSYSYDAVRNLVDVQDPLQRHTKFGYFQNSSLQSLTDPNGNVTSWNIDIQNRVTGKQYADGSQVLNTYENTTSRLKAITDALNQVKQFSYNVDNTPAGTTYTKTVNPTPNVSFAYDPYFQRLVSMTDGSGTTKYTYQPVGSLGAFQLLQEIGPYNNSTIAYQYDALGRMSARTVDTSTETFTYDSLGRSASHASALGTFNLSYLGQTGQLTSQQLQGGTVGTGWTYDTNTNDRRLKTIANSGATRSYQFTTTPENDITQIAESAPMGSAWAPQTWNYNYDPADRLLQGQSSSGADFSYNYNPADNITAFAGPSGNENASYNGLNQITSFNGQSYVYNANGNLLSDGIRTYQWDAENRLIRVTSPSGQSTFAYDGLGRRIAITSNGSQTRYLWCGSTLCQGKTSTDTLTRRYYPEGEVIPLSGALLYYGQDQLGSVRDVTTVQNGSRVASFDYDPYGNSSQSAGRVSTDFRYAGMFYDQQDGLYLTQYRAYDPKFGRWLSRDPQGESGGFNMYTYAGLQPTTHIDPLGLQQYFFGVPISGGSNWGNIPGIASAFPISPPANHAFGGSIAVSVIGSNGGGVLGLNVEHTSAEGLGLYLMNTPNNPCDRAVGFNIGFSAQFNMGVGTYQDSWSGLFDEYSGSYGAGGGGGFKSPDGTGNWFGISGGYSFGLPGLSYAPVLYTPIIVQRQLPDPSK